MGKNVSTLIQPLPQKYEDPGIFTVSCVIGSCVFEDAMLDLGASINVMLKSVFQSLGIGLLQPTRVVVQLANCSSAHPAGLIEDVLVKTFNIFDAIKYPMEDHFILSIDLLDEMDFMDFHSGVSKFYELGTNSEDSDDVDEFDVEIRNRSGKENLVVDHLSRIERDFDDTPIVDDFPDEQLLALNADYVFKWVEVIPIRTDDSLVVVNFARSHIFYKFRVPRVIISDQRSHFYNKHMKALLSKYVVFHQILTPYHPQTNEQAEVSNREAKLILKKTVGPDRKDWSKRLEDALWAYYTSFKTPIRMSPYRIVYGKVCHLPMEIEHRVYWVVKAYNFDTSIAGIERKLQL
ncbi:uncharacterized protein LOC121979825 [Zingiber officinale]|uniref:uncharacterized protein LOC121979825 n=1 Tax=Zingiber officinale TaxID=94328 RepID=UPI001C4B4F38|nr:uncharacterized protein LOC121979825 [Zingiber officinale]